MEYLELMKKRYSCRSFKDIDIEDEKINKILEAAILSPTAVNYQPEKIYVVRDKKMIFELSFATKYTFNANVIFVIAYDRNISWKRYDGVDFGPIDATIVATNMMNMIHELGLGTCFVGSMYQEKIEKILNLPDNIKVLALLPTGYPNEFRDNKKRKNLEEIVEFI